MAGISGLALFGKATPVFAAADNPAGPGERLPREPMMLPPDNSLSSPLGPEQRLQRLEQRLNELAARQEQILRRLGAPPERPGPGPAPGPEIIGPSAPPAGPNSLMVVSIHRLGDVARLIFLGCVVCNLLLAVWIFTDIRKRGEGSGLFVALALVAGIPTAIIYSLVRIGDRSSAAGK
jgi:hypothetical protein